MSEAESDGLLDPALKDALFRALSQDTPGYLTCIDREHRVLFINRTLSRKRSELLGKRAETFIADQHYETGSRCIEDAFQTGRPTEAEYDAVLADGQRRYFKSRVVPVQASDGHAVALMWTEDITEKRKRESELEESLRFRNLVVENIPDFIVLVDRERRLLWVNRTAPGLTQADVLGMPVDAFVAPESLPIVRATLADAFESGKSGQYEVHGYGDGESTAWYLTRVVPVSRGTQGKPGQVESALLMTSDISELKKAEQALLATEEQLHRAQRLESIGQLAGGIAHDFNNLLQVIQSSLHYVQRAEGDIRAVNEELDQIARATQRAAELTSHLLAIGRRKRIEPKHADLDALVGGCVRMLRRTIPENVQFTYQGPQEPCFVAVDAPHFEQVLINLCVNARDAMPGGGKLGVRVEPESQQLVQVVVEDTGSGIPHENLSRVFEPFFTTKGAGSGLGLAVAAGIVAAHGGSIVAESDGKHGTTLRVRLPRVPALASQRAQLGRALPGGSGTILIAEDEELVRAQLARLLKSAGYQVLQADNGALAVELFEQHQREIDLVLLDVIMPELDGWQAYQQMLKLDSNVKALFSTGYAASALPEDFAARGARFISKPYSPQVLLAEVASLLKGTPLPRQP
jgi:PAS domain S-box-containing protein